MQLTGEKEWEVCVPTSAVQDLVGGAEASQMLSAGQAGDIYFAANNCPCTDLPPETVAQMSCATHLLVPGMALVLPQGTIHRVSPVGHQIASHVTLGIERLRWKDLVLRSILDCVIGGEISSDMGELLEKKIVEVSKDPVGGVLWRSAVPVASASCATCVTDDDFLADNIDCFDLACAQGDALMELVTMHTNLVREVVNLARVSHAADDDYQSREAQAAAEVHLIAALGTSLRHAARRQERDRSGRPTQARARRRLDANKPSVISATCDESCDDSCGYKCVFFWFAAPHPAI